LIHVFLRGFFYPHTNLTVSNNSFSTNKCHQLYLKLISVLLSLKVQCIFFFYEPFRCNLHQWFTVVIVKKNSSTIVSRQTILLLSFLRRIATTILNASSSSSLVFILLSSIISADLSCFFELLLIAAFNLSLIFSRQY
jgi:hypothetical protein